MLKLGKIVTDWCKRLRFLRSSLIDFNPHVAPPLNQAATVFLPDGAPAPDYEVMVGSMVSQLDHVEREVIAADRLVTAERSLDGAARRQREKAKRRVGRFITGAREAIQGLFQDEETFSVEQLGFSSLPRDAEERLRLADAIVAKLAAPEIEIPEVLAEDAKEVFERFGGKIRDAADVLRRALAEVARERSQTDAAVAAKNLAIDALKLVYINTSQIFESYCRLAGRDDLAERVRRSRRRRRRGEDEEPAEGLETSGAEPLFEPPPPAPVGEPLPAP